MFQSSLIELSLGAYVAFYAIVAAVILALFWHLQRRDRRARMRFLSQYDESQLRMSPYKIGLVYQLVSATESDAVVVPIWDGKSKVENGEKRQLPIGDLIPFDGSRFSI